MTVQWSELTTVEARIEAIKSAYQPGFSSRDIGAQLGTTRNAIIGMFNRHGDKLACCAMPPPYGGKERRSKPKPIVLAIPPKPGKPKSPSKSVPIFAADPVIEPAMGGPIVVGRPLMMLGARQCRWPVNDAAVGELHLFCGEKAEGSYCPHHARRLVWRRAA